ncbi:hydrogenase maturation nickel metallochaperone HypA/HybF [Desulfotalea psychrophila]|uniref:Hydrogenase maturation factor HypA n=1 Tax=Desulfotalea psychrophila (strain LSv54 / DSM 12343) TaxID=177439 RepID=Q6AQR2_DESPS|nr:hydrogenase maturation nickel metallochaperone HypA [Desulfotalea psychrophila]CAG35311.1 probable hydrogenase accessory protein HypA [Desulfotalea psychrophila LSv54]
MHEMSLVQNLFEQLRDLAKENRAEKIITVTMSIGPLAGVVVDSFQFGFDVLSAEEPLCSGAELKIEIPPVTFTCTDCGFAMESTEKSLDCCQKCGELFLISSGGDDLILKQVVME